MKIEEKIYQLKNSIFHNLTPLIKSDYVLWDLPYHKNIGDLLIWQGEIDFLKTLPYKMLDYASIDTFRNIHIEENTTILLQGGGNFGDIWRGYQNFKLQIIAKYKNNPIIIFPQTVFYQNEKLLEEDCEILNSHKKLTICVRDKYSYELLKKMYRGSLLLLPDMAFCIDISRYRNIKTKISNKTLYLKRIDREFVDHDLTFLKDKKYEIKDWPTFEEGEYFHKILTLMQLSLPGKFFASLINRFASKIHLPYCIGLGIKMLSEYSEIYTTRLHVGILCILLGKPLTYLDNSYGKNGNFYRTWLMDVDGINIIER